MKPITRRAPGLLGCASAAENFQLRGGARFIAGVFHPVFLLYDPDGEGKNASLTRGGDAPAAGGGCTVLC